MDPLHLLRDKKKEQASGYQPRLLVTEDRCRRIGLDTGGALRFDGDRQGPSPKTKTDNLQDVGFDVPFNGESRLLRVTGIRCLANSIHYAVPGDVIITNYRVVLKPEQGWAFEDNRRWMAACNIFDVPLGVIEEATSERVYQLKIVTKDFRCLYYNLNAEEDVQSMTDIIMNAVKPSSLQGLFAFAHASAEDGTAIMPAVASLAANVYDAVDECARMGVDSDKYPHPASPWRLSGINCKYDFCASYPAWLAFPKRVTDSDLRTIATFRRKERVPTLSWCGGADLEYASIWRCSQPMEGMMMMKNRCTEDERLLQMIRGGAPTTRELLLIDCRPMASAWANKASGGGFEEYEGCRLVFGGVENIHHVREAWLKMGKAVANVVEGDVGTWMRDVADSCWYDLMGALFYCANLAIKEVLKHRSNVLVHCSDGWDRTTQVVSLATLCLDATYRTRAGFLRLIQKEFCCFGHPFKTRLALGEKVSSEFSPVFIQWLECVHQLLDQYPHEFEFTSVLLLRLTEEAFTNRFGTFLCDTDRERSRDVQASTLSLWQDLLGSASLDAYRNEQYRPSPRPLQPNISQARYRVWEAYWFRYHPLGYSPRDGTGKSGDCLSETASHPVTAAASGLVSCDDKSDLFDVEDPRKSDRVKSFFFQDDDEADDPFMQKTAND